MASLSISERLVLFALEQFIWGIATAAVGEFAMAGRAGRGVSSAEAADFVRRNPQAVEKALVEGFKSQVGRSVSSAERAQLSKALQELVPKAEAELAAS
ncbi:MAG TPA: hypothetical protein VKD72_25375, partial [Gemmataceae bacterium]|nr:hypothetical protein [Gemmataceae bacterium]